MLTRPITPRQTGDLWFDDVPYLGGLASINVRIAYHWDAGAFTLDDVTLEHVEIAFTKRDGSYDDTYRFGEKQIGKWKQARVNDVIALVEDRFAERV
jgi:hypothetical protein